MRTLLATLTILVLFTVNPPAQAADFGAPSGPWSVGQAIAIDHHATSLSASMTGGQVPAGSIRSIARKKGLALLALISRHLDRRLNSDSAQAIYLSGRTDSLTGRPNSAISDLGDYLLGVNAQFALGGSHNKLKRPMRAILSATPRRVRLTLKYNW